MKILSIVKIKEIIREALKLDKILSDVTKTVDIAKHTGLDPTTIYAFRRDQYNIKIENLDKIFIYLQKEEPERLKLAEKMVEKGLTVDDAIRRI